MPPPRTAQARDKNEADVIEYGFKPFKPQLIQMDAKFGCDWLLLYLGTVEFVEIKNPEYAPKNGNLENMLTKNERRLKRQVESAGKIYWIIATIEQAMELMKELRRRYTE